MSCESIPQAQTVFTDRPVLSPLQPLDVTFHDTDDDYDEDDDIYRGEPPTPPRSPSPISIRSSSSSSSSSGSFLGGGRLGAIAAVVELAITRWARGNASSSSSSSSSSSNRSSIITVSRSQIARRKRRRSSTATLRNVQSDLDISARIIRIKAREESRQIPRAFNLYLPPSLCGAPQPFGGAPEMRKKHHTPLQRITFTSSLPLILTQLDAALKKSVRARRNQERHRLPKSQPEEDQPSELTASHHDYMLPDFTAPSRPASFTDLAALRKTKKGKQREVPITDTNTGTTTPDKPQHLMPKAWWLDVSSPTWEDMRAIGKVRSISLPL